VGERQMRPGSVILTQEGMVFGTPEFMSPEQAQGKTLTPASDVYSLAVILYEVLTGKLPFDAKSAMDYIQLHVTGKPIPLSERVPGRTFPPLLDQIVDRALSKKAEDRYDSAAEFGEALQLVLQGATKLPARLAGPNLRAMEMPTAPIGFAPTPLPAGVGTPGPAPVQTHVAPPQGQAQQGWSPQPGPASANSPNGPAGPAAPFTSQASPAALSVPPRAPKANVPLLLGVALGFLLLGVAMALALTKLMGH
jgi:serine/threonine protein kinase